MGELVTVHWVKASVECGGCGRPMEVLVDQASNIPHGWDLMDLIVDSVRGGLSENTSVQAGLALCGKCTKLVYGIGDIDYEPSDGEIINLLNEHATIRSITNDTGNPISFERSS